MINVVMLSLEYRCVIMLNIIVTLLYEYHYNEFNHFECHYAEHHPYVEFHLVGSIFLCVIMCSGIILSVIMLNVMAAGGSPSE